MCKRMIGIQIQHIYKIKEFSIPIILPEHRPLRNDHRHQMGASQIKKLSPQMLSCMCSQTQTRPKEAGSLKRHRNG